MANHAITNEPQPMADQIMVKCSCGWRQRVSLYDFDRRDDLWDEVRRVGCQHLNEVAAHSPT